MEITLHIDPDLQSWLDRMVKEFGHNHEYWLMEAARVNREDLEDSLIAAKRDAEFQTSGAEAIPLGHCSELAHSRI
jgi:hypothetical protein